MSLTAQYMPCHSAIEAGCTTLNLNLGICTWHQEPRQSTLIQIACKKMKGCRAFYNIFRTRPNDKGNPPKHETKWHTMLGAQLSVRFWDNAWKLHSSIKDKNPFKCYNVQFCEIVSLQTIVFANLNLTLLTSVTCVDYTLKMHFHFLPNVMRHSCSGQRYTHTQVT